MPKGVRKPKHAFGFLVDENLPPAVSEFIRQRAYRVAHVGRDRDYLLQSPPKGTKDATFKKWMQRLVLITKDVKMLRPGRLPKRHRGVFVIDCADSSIMSVLQELFELTDWKRDELYINRRFVISPNSIEEVARDGTTSWRIV
jgi:hypothetical protein